MQSPVHQPTIQFKQVDPYYGGLAVPQDRSDQTRPHHLNRSHSGDNPLMRRLTPAHSRSVSRDIAGPREHGLEYVLPPQTFSQAISSGYSSGQQPRTPPASHGRHGHHGSQHTVLVHNSYREQIAQQTPVAVPVNSYLQPAQSGIQQGRPIVMDYRISNNYTHQDSRVNISTEMVSNDQSRIRPGVLKLRSDSNERSQIVSGDRYLQQRNDAPNQFVKI